MAPLKGRVTFADLSRRWATDRHYGAAIEWVAGSYRAAYCSKPASKTAAVAPTKRKAASALPPAAALGGPGAGARQGDGPVRTIWSRSMQRQAANAARPAATPIEVKEKPIAVPVPQPASRPMPAPTHKTAPAANAPKELAATPAAGAEPKLKPATGLADAAPRGSFAFATAMNVETLTRSPNPQPVAAAKRCRVMAASYGGKKTLLVLARADGEVRYTALTVLDGFEHSMLDNYLKAHAPGGSSVGEFASRDAALARARQLCSGTAEAPRLEGGGAG